MNRKTRKIFEKINKKKNITIGERNRLLIASGIGAVPMSICPIHGPYTPDDLCACYNEGGRHEGVVYDDIVLNKSDNESFITSIAACPIHGSYTSDDLCPCYDENGELKPDWNKDLVDESTEWN